MGSLRFEERLALFVHSLDRANAAVLLEGLHGRPAQRAIAYLSVLGEMPSSDRQGRLSTEFGIRADAPERLRGLWAEAPPTLRRDMYRALPPYHRTLFTEPPVTPGKDDDVDAARRTFAERLVREVTR